MNERKKKWLNAYLIFNYAMLAGWIFGGTGLYLAVIFFIIPDTYTSSPFHSSPENFMSIFPQITFIYIVILLAAIYSVKAAHKLLQKKPLNMINYIALTIMTLLEILPFINIFCK